MNRARRDRRRKEKEIKRMVQEEKLKGQDRGKKVRKQKVRKAKKGRK